MKGSKSLLFITWISYVSSHFVCIETGANGWTKKKKNHWATNSQQVLQIKKTTEHEHFRRRQNNLWFAMELKLVQNHVKNGFVTTKLERCSDLKTQPNLLMKQYSTQKTVEILLSPSDWKQKAKTKRNASKLQAYQILETFASVSIHFDLIYFEVNVCLYMI